MAFPRGSVFRSTRSTRASRCGVSAPGETGVLVGREIPRTGAICKFTLGYQPQTKAIENALDPLEMTGAIHVGLLAHVCRGARSGVALHAGETALGFQIAGRSIALLLPAVRIRT